MKIVGKGRTKKKQNKLETGKLNWEKRKDESAYKGCSCRSDIDYQVRSNSWWKSWVLPTSNTLRYAILRNFLQRQNQVESFRRSVVAEIFIDNLCNQKMKKGGMEN